MFLTNSERLIGISDAFSAFVYGYPSSCPRAHLYPLQKCAYSALHPRAWTYIYRPCLQALTECSPLDFRSSSITTPCLLQHRCRFILTAPARLSRFLAVNLISDRNDATCCTCSRFVSCAAPTVLATSVARTGRAVQFSTDSHGIHHPRLLTTTMNGLRQSCAFAQHP